MADLGDPFLPLVPRSLRLLAAATVLVAVTGAVHLRVERWRAGETAEGRMAARLAAVDGRMRYLVELLDVSAGRIATLPRVGEALAGDRAALAAVFASLEAARDAQRERPALAIYALPLATVAWAGRVADLRAFQGIAGVKRDVFVLAGSVTTTLVATVPINDRNGRLVGLATAELPVAVRRNISNEFLTDFDRLSAGDPALEVHYLDARYEAQGPRPFAPLAPGAPGKERRLSAPDGGGLAAVRATVPSIDETLRPLRVRYQATLSGLACLLVLAWMAAGSATPLRLAGGASALRLVLLALGPAFPHFGSSLLSADTYASPLLGALTRSPLDLLFTTVWAALLAGLLAERALRGASIRAAAWRPYAVTLLALPVVIAVFAWIADTSANCSLDLESVSLEPASAAHAVLGVSVYLILVTGALLLAAVFSWAGPLPASWAGRLARLGFGVAAVALAARSYPFSGPPWFPAVALFLLAALAAGSAEAWRPCLNSAGTAASCGLAAMALPALLLYPTLLHFGEKDVRRQIEGNHAQLVLRQPEWRESVLSESERRIDSLNVLEESPPGPTPPLLEELAFAVWSTTELAAVGFSSAVELQDPAGTIVSRFALNLPSLSGPSQPLPATDEWETTRESLPLASGGGRVLHAQRRVVHHGELHGAVHVYVKDDFWNLPFVRGRDPYSVLYRTASGGAARGRPVSLLAYDWNRTLLFSSAERPPALDAGVVARLRQSHGFWTSLPIDGSLNDAFVFSDNQAIYSLAYPRVAAGRFAANVVEATSALTLLALAGVAILILARSLLRRPSFSLASLAGAIGARFSLRLFVAFIALAVAPVLVLQGMVRSFVAERLRRESEDDAIERAGVAKKALEDFVLYRRGEAPGRQPGLDSGLVYIASLMRNDLDVFDRGRLLASSKRELYASGLLPPRVGGSIYRALVLEGQPSALGTERIGGFSYLVVSVPVRLGAPEPGILSIPLALRQREVEAVLEDLDRTIRLGSVLFLVAAAAFAQSMARRISGPIHELTAATQRLARGDMGARVSITSGDELATLVASFNQMAGDLERQRRDLERSNRLAAWAEMARQVAHEVKNPLTPIQLSAEHLRRVWSDGSPDFGATLHSCTETILRQVASLRQIATEFSAFARPPAARLEPQDVAALLTDVVGRYAAVLPPGVRLSLDAPPAPPVPADRRLLERAVVNLLENAIQAVGEAGTISVGLESGTERTVIEVVDSGPGIHPDLSDRIFEPFFSTKTGGSGLGLALVKKIAEDHGGGASLTSRPGQTRAALWLPGGA
jgi:signal transduction histidine kinase